jgi:hypothetical protein
MRSNLYKLVNGRKSRNNRPITNLNVACKGDGVYKDDVVAYNAIVRYVHIRHDQTIASNNGLTKCFGSAINSYTFTYGRAIAYFNCGGLAVKFQILRDGGDDGTWEDAAIGPDSCTGHDGDIGTYPSVFTNNNILRNGREWTYFNAFGQLGVGVYGGHLMNHYFVI